MVPCMVQMNKKDKIIVLTNLEDGWLIKDLAAKFCVDRTTIFHVKKKAEKELDSIVRKKVPKRKVDKQSVKVGPEYVFQVSRVTAENGKKKSSTLSMG